MAALVSLSTAPLSQRVASTHSRPVALSLTDRVGLTPARRAVLEATIAHDRTLGDVVQRGGHVVDVIIQDEYTHDVVVADGELYLVYDST
jgi:hypothetical protein